MGVPFVGFPLYKYVVGGVKGDCRNIFHERSVCGFLRAVLDQQFQASLVVWRYISTGYSLFSVVGEFDHCGSYSLHIRRLTL